MEQEQKLTYLKQLNKDLVNEVVRLEMLKLNLKSRLTKQQRAIKLINELQQAIATAKNNEEFLRSCARLINSILDMGATFIYTPAAGSNKQFELLYSHFKFSLPGHLNENKTLELSELPGIEKYILINSKSSKNSIISNLQKKFNLSSLIVFPIRYSDSIKFILITGHSMEIDHIVRMDLSEDDIRTIEAVSILISSYLRKVELIKLNETDKIKTEYISNLSHEFRTPLTLVLGLLEEIKAGKNDLSREEVLEKISIVIKNSRRIEQLIEQLLDISKIETQTQRLTVKKSNLSEFVNNISGSFSSLADKENISFTYSFSSYPAETWYDEDKLEKIITNLLSNAFKYSGAEGKVVLMVKHEYKKGRAMVIFSVKDSGPGIPDEEKEKVFERFYRMESSVNGQHEGTGVGLYLVKKLTEIHHGSIKLQSRLNKGTVFTIKIPVSKNSFNDDEIALNLEVIGSVKVSKDACESFGHTRKRIDAPPQILIVEDNKELNQYISSGLSKEFSVSSSFDGKAGLETAISQVPDLIITDIMMPLIDGIQMCRQLKSSDLTKHIPVIMLTAKADRESKLTGFQGGADDYITKPFDMEELSLKVSNLVETVNQIKQQYRKELFTDPVDSEIPVPKDRIIRDIIGMIKKNLSDPDFTVSDIYKELALSRAQLYRKINALTGYKPGELIRIIRLRTAATYFRKGHKNVAQVMYMVGYNNQSNFASNFNKLYGFNPSAYIKNIQSI